MAGPDPAIHVFPHLQVAEPTGASHYAPGPAPPQPMTPNEFIAKWKNVELTESAAAQSQFIDLCRVLDEPTPSEADPKGTWYAFEKGALKTGGGDGWADVWKRGCFAWEYKGKGRNLDTAFAQLQRYAIALENPPLLIVSDMERFRIHTNWTNTVQSVIEIPLEELADDRRRRVLKWAFSETEVEQLKPGKTRQELTEDVAKGFAQLAQRLRERGHEAGDVAHFVNRLVFCMFAEDVDLLPNHMFRRMLEASLRKPAEFETHARQLFAAMKSGGVVGFERVEYFNGGLFEDDRTLPLTEDDIKQTLEVARLDWSNIDPSIMGTLFERGLDPDKRSQLGAHYTDRDKIMLIVNPVIVEPLMREWEETKAKIEALVDDRETSEAQIRTIQATAQKELETDRDKVKTGEQQRRNRITALRARSTKVETAAETLRDEFLERLRSFRVLDPACGSGNFLYLSLHELKNLEHRANLDAEALGLPRRPPRVGPQCVKGIEINPFAAELARVSVWIGEIQWMKRNGFDAARNPILKPLETIECRDALLNVDGTEADWPKTDVIVGNPPFLGRTFLREGLGDREVNRLYRAFIGKVSPEADLVCYWFAKAWIECKVGNTQRVGLVATNSIRSGANRTVIGPIAAEGKIFNAWADEPWVVDGADVRVSLIAFGQSGTRPWLNGQEVTVINADLTARRVDLTSAQTLAENRRTSFQGTTKGGAFEVDRRTAEAWLQLPVNVNGQPNSRVLHPITSGGDIVRRSELGWAIDFDACDSESEASKYEAPFGYILEHVRPIRTDPSRTKREAYRLNWWRFAEGRPSIRAWLQTGRRYIGTPKVSRHRVFVWLPATTLPDNLVIAILRDDDACFGILSSRHHVAWSIAMGAWIGVGNDPTYTPTSSFETFPFPEGLTPNIPAADYTGDPRAIAIAEAAKELNRLRENWLNPEDLVDRVPEVVPGYPDRIVPKDDKAAATLKKRTLTNLYNERPAWLDHAHRKLDEAVAAAYGWPANLSDEEILERLFKLNQERAAAQ
jgi:type II restriction/modification system DNA methylase subunit YeeA